MSGRSTRTSASGPSRFGAQARRGVTARSQPDSSHAFLLQNLADQIQELSERTNNLHQAFEESTPRLPPSPAEFESTPPHTAAWPRVADFGGADDSAWGSAEGDAVSGRGRRKMSIILFKMAERRLSGS